MKLATIADVGTINTVVHKAYRTLYGWTLELPFVGGERISTEEIAVLVKKNVLFIWERNGVIIATACVERNKDKEYGELSLFSVLPDYQSQGMGRHVLFECLHFMKETLLTDKCRILVLDVRIELINMYERFGFEKTDERVPFVLPQHSKAGNLFFIVMEKEIKE